MTDEKKLYKALKILRKIENLGRRADKARKGSEKEKELRAEAVDLEKTLQTKNFSVRRNPVTGSMILVPKK